jgi:hypothetical protein
MITLRYIGSESSPDEGVLWGVAVVKGGEIDIAPSHPDYNTIRNHPWFQIVDASEATSAPDVAQAADADVESHDEADPVGPDTPVKQRRRRRTKAEMEAARAAEAHDDANSE